MNYLYGIISIMIGVILVLGTENIMRMFGRVEWAETHMSTWGGSRMFTKFLGVGLIFLGFIFMGGWFGPLLRALFTPTGQ
ncbi:MAG: hypothetical protein ABIB97_03735 [Patescibacteria group bacterium]